MKQKNGFTLVEILVVMAIIIMMATIMVGILNAVGITNKGRDAQRKKDLNRIKIAFEEYFNDKGEFPLDYTSLNKKENCKSDVFAPYLTSWPCDPNGQPYYTYVEVNKFRVITNLENKKDKDILIGWYLRGDDFNLFGLGVNSINYGVSSANILWYDQGFKDYSSCDTSACYFLKEDGSCGEVTAYGCKGSGCYYRSDSACNNSECQVGCCLSGCLNGL